MEKGSRAIDIQIKMHLSASLPPPLHPLFFCKNISSAALINLEGKVFILLIFSETLLLLGSYLGKLYFVIITYIPQRDLRANEL